MDEIKKVRFIDFFKQIWWWNILLDFILLIVAIYALDRMFSGRRDDMQNLHIIETGFCLGVLQFVFLLILFIRHVVKKHVVIAVFLCLHLIGLFFLTYGFVCLLWWSVFPV
jgi:hypothetical protein